MFQDLTVQDKMHGLVYEYIQNLLNELQVKGNVSFKRKICLS